MSSSPTKFHPVTHVIFDCDGLLVDSEKYYSEGISEVAAKYGKEFNYQIKIDMMGKFC
jgi:pseudouridine-5'-monophosphatase